MPSTARARRVSSIRRRVAAAVLASFALAWGAIVWDGSMGAPATSASTAPTATTASASGTTPATSTTPDPSSEQPAAVTTRQS